MKKILLGLLVAIVFIAPTTASAAWVKNGDQVSYDSGETISENLYVSGAMINLGADMWRDVYAAGANVMISGPVGHDLNVVGSNVSILGSVGDDLRVAGAQVTINQPVAGELMAAGGFVQLLPTATIGGSAWVAGGMVNLEGEIGGDLNAGGGKVYINSVVKGSVNVRADESIVLGPKAEILGGLTYSCSTELVKLEGATVAGAIERDTKFVSKQDWNKSRGRHGFANIFFGMMIFRTIVLVIVGLLLVHLFKRSTNMLLSRVSNNFGNDFGRGLAILVVLPLIAIFLCFTVVLMPFGMIIGLIYFGFMILAKCFAGIVFGVWLHRKLNPKQSVKTVEWPHALIGGITIGILGWIPIIGWILNFVIVLAIFGSCWYLAYEKFLVNQHK